MTDRITDPKTPRPLAQRIGRALWLVGVNLLLTLAFIEIALRAQQAFEPLYDLDLNPDAVSFTLSDELNHTYTADKADWDANGIRRLRVPNTALWGAGDRIGAVQNVILEVLPDGDLDKTLAIAFPKVWPTASAMGRLLRE